MFNSRHVDRYDPAVRMVVSALQFESKEPGSDGVVHFSPSLLARLNRRRRCVTRKWQMDKTDIEVDGEWM